MTTILIEKTGFNDVTIYASKVQEVLSKEIASWPKNFYSPSSLPVTPTDDVPIRQSMDFLNLTREFTITGTIDGNSTSAGNALDARDTIVNMCRSGGTASFRYGLPSDVSGSGYSSSSDNIYYAGDGFTVQIRRIMVDETPKGGSGSEHSSPEYSGNSLKKAPEQFDVTITLLWAENIGTS